MDAALKNSEVEDVEVVEVAKAEASPHKLALLAELARWKGELEQLATLLEDASENDVLSDLLYKSQSVVTALDKEAVYLGHMAQVLAQRLKESQEVKEDVKQAD